LFIFKYLTWFLVLLNKKWLLMCLWGRVLILPQMTNRCKHQLEGEMFGSILSWKNS
jgi:hypothetical protein